MRATNVKLKRLTSGELSGALVAVESGPGRLGGFRRMREKMLTMVGQRLGRQAAVAAFEAVDKKDSPVWIGWLRLVG